MKTTYVDQFYRQLNDLADDLADILMEYPNGLPDDICADGEVPDLERVQEMFGEMLGEGQIEQIEKMLKDADTERAKATSTSGTPES